MRHQECVAMLLAGGQGSRLGALTKKIAKPAVAFGGKYRIIDFSLSNCTNSGIQTVGVLTQYKPLLLNSYIGTGAAWDLDSADGGVSVLQPYSTETGGQWYEGTADAIYQNIDYLDNIEPEYVVILSGDHLYKMDYSKMLAFHKVNEADLTISVMEVPWEDTSRFGILTADSHGRISKFTEKPKDADSNLASMGIYIFSWPVLRDALIRDAKIEDSDHDFGKNIIPMLLAEQKRLFAYTFSGYWKDVGTISSYYETNMELLEEDPAFDIFNDDTKIFSNANMYPPHFVGESGVVKNSIICNGAEINGSVEHSIISFSCVIEEGAVVKDAILLPGAKVRAGAVVNRAIIGENTIIDANAVFGDAGSEEIAIIGDLDIVRSAEEKGGEDDE